MKSENRPNWDDILLADRRIFPDHMNPAPTAEEEVIEPHLLRESIRERVRTFPMAPVTAIMLKLP